MYSNALIFAIEAHKNQKRKDDKPYIFHPVSVAMELAKNGADDDLISAGLLHDTIEDTTVSYDELEEKFGENIAKLVLSDTEDKKLSWEERKKAAIEFLRTTDDYNTKMLICADKLANVRDIKSSIEKNGDDTWTIFRYGKDKQKWLYNELVDALKSLNNLPMYQEFKQIVTEIF